MPKYTLLIVFFGLSSCRHGQPDQNTKTLDFGAFSIETPKSWTQIRERGTDSYVGRIAIDAKDTLEFDLGWYSNNLYEYDPTILDSDMISSIDTFRRNIRDIIFVKNSRHLDPDKYRRNNISWDTIDGRKAKIVYPRESGIGMTGIYVDSLFISGSEVDRFNLYGNNLRPSNEREVLAALRTLKFHKR